MVNLVYDYYNKNRFEAKLLQVENRDIIVSLSRNVAMRVTTKELSITAFLQVFRPSLWTVRPKWGLGLYCILTPASATGFLFVCVCHRGRKSSWLAIAMTTAPTRDLMNSEPNFGNPNPPSTLNLRQIAYWI